MREPTVVRWPGKIPTGVVNDEVMTAMDLLPTFAMLVGGEIPSDRVIDGKNIWPVLAGTEKSPHEAFFYHQGDRLEAVRSGKWKLHLGKPNAKGKAGKGKSRGNGASAGSSALYDLEADMGEKDNLIQEHPESAEQLRSYAEAFEEELSRNSRPAGLVKKAKPLTKREN